MGGIGREQRPRLRAGLAVADHGIVDANDRHDERGRAGQERLVGRARLVGAERALFQPEPKPRSKGDQREPRYAVEDGTHRRVGDQPVALDDPGVRRGTFCHHARVVDLPGLVDVAAHRLVLGEDVRQQRDRLDVGPLPADVGHGDHRNPFVGQLARRHPERAHRHDDGGFDPLRQLVVTRRHATRDLDVERARGQPVETQQLSDLDAEMRLRERHRDADLAERPRHPREMEVLVDHAAADDCDHLVNRVGELVAAVLDMDHGHVVADILAVHVGNSGHLEFRLRRILG